MGVKCSLYWMEPGMPPQGWDKDSLLRGSCTGKCTSSLSPALGAVAPDLATSEVKVTVALPAWWVFSGFFAQSLHLHGPRRGLLTCPPSLLASLQGHWVRRVLERSRRDPLFATPSAAAAALDPTSPAQITATAFPFWPPISLLSNLLLPRGTSFPPPS